MTAQHTPGRVVTGYADLRRAEKECEPEDVVETNVGFLCALRRNADDRDGFAKVAMGAMVASQAYVDGGWAQADIAKQAYDMADAMMKARDA